MTSFSGPEGVYTHLHFQASFAPLSYLSHLSNSSSTSNTTSNSGTSPSTSSSTANNSTSSNLNVTKDPHLSTTPSALPISAAGTGIGSGFNYNPNAASTNNNSSTSTTTTTNSQSQSQQAPIPQYVPRLSSVSVRNISNQSSQKKNNKNSTISTPAATSSLGGGLGSSASQDKGSSDAGDSNGIGGNSEGTSTNAGDNHLRNTINPGRAGGGVNGNGGNGNGHGPMLESPLAAQGIDAYSFSLTGGSNGINASSLLALPFGSKSGLFPEDFQGDNSSNPSNHLISPSPTSNDPSQLLGGEKKLTRPKNSLKSTSSSFIQRVMFHPDSTKILASRDSKDSYYFLSTGKSFLWLSDLQSKTKDPLARITFTSAPTCHDVNQLTRSSSNLDVLIGFSSGDVFWLDPIIGKYSRINKNINSKSLITQIRWLPNSETLFMTSHEDGTVLIWDREREEAKEGSWKLSQFRREDTSSAQTPLAGVEDQFRDLSVEQQEIGGEGKREEMEILDSENFSSSRPTGAFHRRETSDTVSSKHSNVAHQSSQAGTSNPTSNTGSGSGSSRHLPPGAWNPKHSIIVTHPGQATNPNSIFTPSQSSSRNHLSSTPGGGGGYLTPGISANSSGTPLGSSVPSNSSLGLLPNGNGVAMSPLARYQSLGNGNGNGIQEPNDYLSVNNSGSSLNSWNSTMGTSGKGKEISWNKLNPVSHWRVGRGKINDFAFSPDFQHVAMIAEDGILRIIDLATEKLIETFDSFFGAFTCLAWSPDGRFLLAGSQDDLVTLYAPREGRVVARCQGHSSFVTGVAFDPWRWSDRTYRFASVGEDLKLILWDFSSASLGRTKHAGGPHPHHGPSNSTGRRSFALASTPSLVDRYGSGRRSIGFDRPMIENNDPDSDAINHEAPSRSEIPLLQPVLVHQIQTPGRDKELLSSVRFNPIGLNLLYRSGAVDSFLRPDQSLGNGNGNGNGSENRGEEGNGKAINIPDAGVSRKKTNQGGRFLGLKVAA